VRALVDRYGLVAIWVGAVLEGDVALLVAGMMAHLGLLEMPAVLATGFAGLVTSDAIWFAIGRAYADWLQRSRIYRRAAPIVERLAGRAGPIQIVIARLVYGTRVASMLFWGARGLPVRHFLLLDALGCAVWTVTFVSLGYGLSGSVELLIGRVRKLERYLAAGVALAILIVILLHLRGRRRAEAIRQQRPEGEAAVHS
jgi:membrane protein DedA with SNARE-associated domain